MTNLFKDPRVNEALTNAYEWATSDRTIKSAYASSARRYINSIGANRRLQPKDTDGADRIQLLYIISNLQYWRGEKAREAKATLNNYIDSINKKDN